MTKKMHKYSGKKLSRGEPPNYLGQHLLHKKQVLYEMIKKASVSKQDTVLELGAGKGALTTILAQKAAKVLAVEYDHTFVQILKLKTAKNKNTQIIHEDILKINLPKKKYVVVASIPYAITTPIMKMLLNHPSGAFDRGVIIMEKGAGKRFTATFIRNAYVLVWRMWFDLTYMKDVSRDCFSPPPKVDSAMIKITRKNQPLIENKHYMAFLGLAQYALKQPKASMEMVLKGVFTAPQMKHLKRNLGVKSSTMIGKLPEEQWQVVFYTMIQHVARPLWPKPTNPKKGSHKRTR
ncbi:ribosomal RNA small subunit methyltransferase A [Virgibacillus pantothenticus]|uniref:rRNA adenine N-6-methyltransferase n=1 Tax=Virgibacillus pantothenticus TaxID=1473 RepID=A0A0L0QV03_VIRPA|nr:23S ribosomal RNA methyltransferase Erm [Virgibacillus pantothenticus]KNE22406.1 rRNA adenine methyltransferase [Virgibacillus pantothenticus]MED3738288.1 23S ribosomal RNA methyltransferase Erm [Virgibacillus pantothenticus]QTY16862.1 23S ribosomal RNA methyltransferase Erm [Virgibacillus pantothenticus]SIS86119.1 23S rRNA (adenine-N6)-dimethyltransferase [Virgibacillus pantothenticus]GIP63272.1 ribosomal RNA small subunit methyltransferase A [Virgibacillus pantothenticus]